MRIKSLSAVLRATSATVLAAVVLVGCGSPTSPNSLLPHGSGGSSIMTSIPAGPFGTFVAVAAVGHEIVDGSQVVFEFSNEGLSVRTGCNALTGRVRVDELGADTMAGRLYVDNMSRTEMGCEPALMAQEEWLAAFLAGSPDWVLEDYLTLTGRGVVPESLTLQPRKLGAPVPVEFTYWTLSSLIDGETVSSVPAGVKATMHMDKGQIWFSAGCTEFTGAVSIEPTSSADGSLAITVTTSPSQGCPDQVAAVERMMLRVLTGRVPFKTDEHDRLTVGTPNGQALEFAAR